MVDKLTNCVDIHVFDKSIEDNKSVATCTSSYIIQRTNYRKDIKWHIHFVDKPPIVFQLT